MRGLAQWNRLIGRAHLPVVFFHPCGKDRDLRVFPCDLVQTVTRVDWQILGRQQDKMKILIRLAGQSGKTHIFENVEPELQRFRGEKVVTQFFQAAIQRDAEKLILPSTKGML